MSRNQAVGDTTQMRTRAIRMAWLTLALAGLLALPGGAKASTSELDMAGLQPIDDGQLANMRGGFNVGGVNISFGVIMETAINGVTKLLTSFNLDNPSHVNVMLDGAPALPGAMSGDFVLKQAANGGFVLTNGHGTTTLQQMGNMGGGLIASIQNSLNNQVIQQQTTINVGIQNMNTLMGLSTIDMMMDRMGVALVR